MRPTLPQLLVNHPDTSLRERVARACGDEFAYAEAEDWGRLEEMIRAAEGAALLLVDPYDGYGVLSSKLYDLIQNYPSTPVIAALDVRPERHDDVRQLGRWGVVQVVSLGRDDTPLAITHRLRQARGRPMRMLLESALPPETSGRARAIIDTAADVVAAGELAQDLARRLKISRRTLLRWSERAGIPPPRRLLAWMRVLLACELLGDPGRSVSSVARAAGYASDAGLRRVMQNFLGESPTSLRRQGAVKVAMAAFVKEMNDSRLRVRITTREG